MPVLLHGVPQRLPPSIGAGENLQFAAAIIVEPLDPPLARCCAILVDICRLSAGLGRLCHHVSGSKELPKDRQARWPAAPPRSGGWGIEDESRSEDARGTCRGYAY